MEMEAFLAQSPDAAQVREHIAAARVAIDTIGHGLRPARPELATTADFHRYLNTALQALEAARVLVPVV
jgi:hypothetical protein